MRLIRFNPTGLFGYGAHPYVELDARGIVLFQGPVGSGKSSFFNALCETLFGMSPPRVGTRDVTESDIVNKCWRKQSFSAVDLEANGHHYRVGYARAWKDVPVFQGPSQQIDEAEPYGGTSVWFERWDGSRWVQRDAAGQDLRYPKMQDTWKKIAETIGMDFDTFCNVSYVAQDQALKFIRGANRDREEIVTQIKRLGVYDEGQAVAQQRAATTWQEYRVTAGIVSNYRQHEESIQIDELERLNQQDRARRAEQKLAELDSQIENVQARIQAVEAMRAAHQQAIVAARQDLDQKVQEINERAAAATRARSAAEQEKTRAAIAISKIPNSSADLDGATARMMSARAAHEAEQRRLSSMLPGAGRCPSCGSVIDDTTLATHKAEQHAVVSAAHEAVVAADQLVRQQQQQLVQDRAARQQQIEQERDRLLGGFERDLTAALQAVMAAEAEKAAMLARLQAAEQQASREGTGDLLGQVGQLQRERSACATDLATAQSALQAFEARRAERASTATKRAELEVKAAAEDREAREWAWLAKRYPQIKQLKFASILQDLNEHLAHYLGVLTDGRTSVVLSPYRVKKDAQRKPQDQRTADDYVFEFDMQVEETGKPGVPIQLYSGGQRGRITLALIAAFWELAARQGSGTNVLLLDEVISFMDPASIEKTVRLIEHLRERIGTLVIVGHDPTLPHLLRRDELWTCRYDGATTTMEISR